MLFSSSSNKKNASSASAAALDIGGTLMAAREQRGMHVTDISEATKLTPRIVSFMENNQWHRLPPPLYTAKFIAKYADLVGADTQLLVGHYIANIPAHMRIVPAVHQAATLQRTIMSRRWSWWRVVLFIVIIGAFLAYLLSGVQDAFIPPQITFFSTAPFSAPVRNNFVLLTGTVDQQAQFSINGTQVFIAPNGSFSYKANLSSGVNDFVFQATNHFGRSETIVKQVLAEYN